MNLSNAINLGRQANWSEACARVNPGNSKEWYIMLIDRNEKSYMLVDDNDVPITCRNLDAFIPILKEIGLKSFSVIFK